MKTRMLAASLAAALALGACGGGGSSGGSGQAADGGMSVYTNPAFKPLVDDLVAAYRKTHAGAKVTVTAEGDQANTTKAVADGRAKIAVVPSTWVDKAKEPVGGSLGRNLAVVAVPAANPAKVTGTDAFAKSSKLRTTVCGAKTPIGDFSLLVLKKAGVTPKASTVSTSANCPAQAMQDLSSGKLDAALVFRASVKVPSTVKLIVIPPAQNLIVSVNYVVGSKSRDATQFAAFLGSAPAREILTRSGYLP